MKHRFEKRILSLILCLSMVFTLIITHANFAFSAENEEENLVSGLTDPFRKNMEFMLNGEPVKSTSYRIPTMVTLADGTIVAAADIRWNTTYDGGGLDTLVARSTDGGKSWQYTVANYLGDNGNEYDPQSTTFIDPSLLVAKDGKTVYMLVDLYAYGVALNGVWGEYSQPLSDTGFNAEGYLKLSSTKRSTFDYYLKDGKIWQEGATEPVEGYTVDGYFNIYYNGEKKGNLFCADSPYQVPKTQYLYLTKSTDAGETWSEPTLLNLRSTTAYETALLVAPVGAITTSKGVMVYPVYSYDGTNEGQRSGLIYSTDGVNWERTANFAGLDRSSEASVVELHNGKLRVFFRCETSRLSYADYDLEAKTWSDAVVMDNVPINSDTQMSAISYSRTSNDKQVVLVSCPTGPNAAGSNDNDGSNRINGKIHVLTVNSDGSMTLEKTIDQFETLATGALSAPYTEEDGFFAYSAMTERADGSVLLLYENNQNYWGAGADKYFTITLKGHTADELGITLDAPKNVILDKNGNRVNSVTVSQYEKAELSAVSPFSKLTADVKYQWQICYDVDNNLWVDIYGEDEKTIKISYGMVATMLDENGMTAIRCESKTSTKTAYSNPIVVTLEMYEPKEPDVVVSESFTTSSGETVTVSVAGDIPEDASVALEETDSSGVDVNEGETVVASLDISIKNADGTEWQPESGETVKVELPATAIGLNEGDRFVVYHLHQGEVKVLGTYMVTNGTVAFDVDGFSKFVFALAVDTSNVDYAANVEGEAFFNPALYDESLNTYNYVNITDKPENGLNFATGYVFNPQNHMDLRMIIEDYYLNGTGYWYKVKAADGYTLPAELEAKPWIYQNDIPTSNYANNLLIIPPAPKAPDVSGDLDKHAKFTYSADLYIEVTDVEPYAGVESMSYSRDQFSTDFTVMIDDYKVITVSSDIVDKNTGVVIGRSYVQSLWYKVNVVSGTCTDEFKDGFWVLQNYLTEGDEYPVDTLTLFDAPVIPDEPVEPSVGITVNGETVNEITVSKSDKVTVDAKATFETADISYKWQICYDTVNDLWVDITGENNSQISISAGMVISLMDENNQVKVRCSATAGSRTVVSDPILVTLDNNGIDNANAYVDIKVDGIIADSIDITEADKANFSAVLSAKSTMLGSLTYKWSVLFDPDTNVWKTLSNDTSISLTFDRYAGGIYIGNKNYIHAVDETTSAITIQLSITDGENTKYDTFVINVKSEATASYSYYRFGRFASFPGAKEGSETPPAGSTTLYNIIINYMDQYGVKPMANPYTSTVSPTTALTNTVKFPTIVGYEPMVYDNVNQKWVPCDSHTFDGSLFTEDFILEVRYFPTYVEYKVNIYTQNAENDEYILYKSFTDEEKTGTVKNSYSFDIPGYYQSRFSTNSQDTTIAADGSTVLNLYYDRMYYLMKFDLDGGYGVQPVYARHGTPIEEPIPVKPGYTLMGWDADGDETTLEDLPTEMPIGGGEYKAVWKAADTAKVTVVFWGENPNDEKYSYISSHQISLKPGISFNYEEEVLTCGEQAHKHTVKDGCYVLKCTQTEHVHSEDCYDCNQSEATHTRSCYEVDGNGTISNNPVGSGYNDWIENAGQNANGLYVVNGWGGNTSYYVKIDGSFYQVNNANKNTKVVLKDNCGCHTHSDDCCRLNLTAHEHTIADCYNLTCSQDPHNHTAACYPSSHTLDTDLWELVKSDTITVAADGSSVINVYYDRTSFTYTFYPANSSSAYGSITDKWGANIYDRWRAICAKANDTNNWTVNSDGDGPWTSYIGVMGTSNMNYYGYNSSNTSTAYYYFEKLDGTYPTDTSDSKNPLGVPAEGSRLSITKEDVVLFEGFTYQKGYDGSGTQIYIDFNGDNTYGSYNNAKFYFSRNKYILEFNNGESIVKTVIVPYQGPLSGYAFTPTPPSYYEAGSVQFAGWYQNPECTGEEVVLSNTTMPSSNKLLYAKWVPVNHDVTIYRYKNEDGTFPTGGDILTPTFKVPHGSTIQDTLGAIPEEPGKEPYTFVGWFYMDGNVEKAFDFSSMTVTKDLQIYAKWSSNVQLPYKITYKLFGTDTEVAAPTEGKQYAGETATFQAKTGSQLFSDYQIGYFPTISSHSIAFKVEDGSYEYTFWYVSKNAVPYTVYYVTDKQNSENSLTPVTLTEKVDDKEVTTTYYIVAETKQVNDNRHAIVTENFKTVSGYMPDAYQKTLIINGTDGATNQIIFKYTVDNEHAFFKVNHYTQQINGSWYNYSSFESKGTLGDRITENPMTIPGFTYDRIEYKVNGQVVPATSITPEGVELTVQGLEINLYYTRNKYPYTVEYRVQGTGELLYNVPNLENQYYSDTVSHTAPLYWGEGDVYQRVSAETLTTTIQTDSSKNVIVFYYKEREVTIRYEVMDGFGGTVNPTQETVLIQSENVQGSKAEPLSSAYKFLGWYDKDGNLVGSEPEFKPKKVNGLNVAATYYAKFEYNFTSLTIQKQGWQNIDPNQTFIFNVKGKDVDLDVTVHGNGSVTIEGLTVGATYTVTEKTDWSWRYECTGWEHGVDKGTGNVATITLGLDGIITFTNSRSEEKWLDGDSWCNNLFK